MYRDILTLKRPFGANIFSYLRLIWLSGPKWTVASVVLVILQGVLPLLTLLLTKLAVDAVVGGQGYDTILGFRAVVFFIVLLGLASLLEAVAVSLDKIVSLIQGNILTDRMFDFVHAKSSEIDLEYYENPQYHDTLHRAQQEAPVRPARVLNNSRQLIQNCLSIVAIGGLLLWLHWSVVFVLLGAAIPGALVRMAYARKVHFWERRRTPVEREASYLNALLTSDAAAKEIRLFSLASLFMERFRKLQSQIRREKVSIVTKKTLTELITMAGAICVSFGLLAFLALRTVQGLMTIGDLVMFYAAVQRGQMLLRQVFLNVADLYEDNLSLSNYYKFLELPAKLDEPADPKRLNGRLKTGIVFDQVSFKYPGSGAPVLENISLTIRPGEHIALVGENGAGKSTLVKLLCRLYDPTSGAITLDGIDLREYATKDVRQKISVVFQDYGRYHLTARENIWLGNVDLPTDSPLLGLAARKAGIDEIISGLPGGYDTVLGRWFEGGKELSIGEWQKIAIARAFLRDGEVIVFDEPGSALDAKSEFEIFEQFDELVKGKTAILISHRLSTVKMVDCIYVLNQGKITESGTHEELMEKSGTYAWMFEAQAQRYR